MPLKKPDFLGLYGSHDGQAGLIAVAMTIVIALVIGASSLSGLSIIGAKRSIATKQSLQTYYAAQAGIQEALATRMLPRSNVLNFKNSTNLYFARSGKIYQNPNDTSQGLVGLYRYIILGGDPARQANGSYYSAASMNPQGMPRLLASNTIPADGSFIVISNGMTCKPSNQDALASMDKFVFSTPLKPACQGGYVLDELTLVAQVRLAQEGPLGVTMADKVEKMRVYKTNQNLKLPASAFVQGYGWVNAGTSIDFEQAWSFSPTDIAQNPLKLERVIFYNFADNTIYANVSVTDTITNVADVIPSNAAIRLYFNGPIDYRSISPSYEPALADCKPQPPSSPNQQDNCNIRVVSNPPMSVVNHAYGGNTIIPLFPGSTQVILIPPLVNTLPGGTLHQIEVDTTKMKSYNDVAGPADYRIQFTSS